MSEPLTPGSAAIRILEYLKWSEAPTTPHPYADKGAAKPCSTQIFDAMRADLRCLALHALGDQPEFCAHSSSHTPPTTPKI